VSPEGTEQIGLIVVCFLMVILLIKLLIYVRRQGDRIKTIEAQLKLMDSIEKEAKNNG